MIRGQATSEICRKLAESAALHHHDVLAQILRMAALKAAETDARYIDSATDIREQLVGTWDWDIINDRVYADGPAARLFGIDDDTAALGSPIENWLSAVHPDDLPLLSAEIARTMNRGHVFAIEYRLAADGQVRWIYARGRCTFDEAGRPVRFPGVFIDITREKIDDNHTSIAPQ